MRRLIVVLLMLPLVTAWTKCSDDEDTAGPPLSEDAPIDVERVFDELSFQRPVAMVQNPANDNRWYVVEQRGVVHTFSNSQTTTEMDVFLDISDLTGVDPDAPGERGLFSIAFDPNFATNRYVFVSYTRQTPSLTSRISRFRSSDGGQTLDLSTETVVLTLPQPFNNHNGGQIAFGPDNLLYIAFGDGGGTGDPGDRAQDTTNLYGSILRIDPSTLPNYIIPATNPFFGNARCDDGIGTVDCPEVFAWGLRNPWRFSFDSTTDELWAADVGQDDWEEVDLIVNSGNYGWRLREGAHCYNPSTGCPTAGLTDPVVEYGNSLGSSVTGGFVYRGSQNQPLVGSYVFGDYSSGRIFRVNPGSGELENLLDTTLQISSFGEGNDGEIYVVDYGGDLYRIVAAP